MSDSLAGKLGTHSPVQGFVAGPSTVCHIEESRTVLATGEGIPLVNFGMSSPEGARVHMVGSPLIKPGTPTASTYEADAEMEKPETPKKPPKKRPTKIERMNRWMCGARNINKGRSKEDRARLQYQLATHRNRLRYEHQIRTGEYDPARRAREKKLKKMQHKSWKPKTREEYNEMRRQRAILKRQERFRTFEFLKTEQKMLELLINIYDSLSEDNRNEKRCIELLTELQNLPLRSLLLIKNPEVVYTVSRIVKHPDKAVREKAMRVCDRFMAMFGVPEDQTFMEAFNDEVAKFQENNERDRLRAVDRSQRVGCSSSSDSDSEADHEDASDSESDKEDEENSNDATDASSLCEFDTSLVRPEDEISESNGTDLSMDESEDPVPEPERMSQVNLVPGLNGGILNKYTDSYGSMEALFDRVAQVLTTTGPEGQDQEVPVTEIVGEVPAEHDNMDNVDELAVPNAEPSTSTSHDAERSMPSTSTQISSPLPSTSTRATRNSQKSQPRKPAKRGRLPPKENPQNQEQDRLTNTEQPKKAIPIPRGKKNKRAAPVTTPLPAETNDGPKEEAPETIPEQATSISPTKSKRKSTKWKPPTRVSKSQEPAALGTKSGQPLDKSSSAEVEEQLEAMSLEETGAMIARLEKTSLDSGKANSEGPGSSRRKTGKKARQGQPKAKADSDQPRDFREEKSSSRLEPTQVISELNDIFQESRTIIDDCMLVVLEHQLEDLAEDDDTDSISRKDTGHSASGATRQTDMSTESNAKHEALVAVIDRLQTSNGRLEDFAERLRQIQHFQMQADLDELDIEMKAISDKQPGDAAVKLLEEPPSGKSTNVIVEEKAGETVDKDSDIFSSSQGSSSSAFSGLPRIVTKKKLKRKSQNKSVACKKQHDSGRSSHLGTSKAPGISQLDYFEDSSQGSSGTSVPGTPRCVPKKKLKKKSTNKKDVGLGSPKPVGSDAGAAQNLSPKETPKTPNLSSVTRKPGDDLLESSPEMMRSKPSLISSVYKSFSQVVRGAMGLSPEDKRRGKRSLRASPRIDTRESCEAVKDSEGQGKDHQEKESHDKDADVVKETESDSNLETIAASRSPEMCNSQSDNYNIKTLDNGDVMKKGTSTKAGMNIPAATDALPGKKDPKTGTTGTAPSQGLRGPQSRADLIGKNMEAEPTVEQVLNSEDISQLAPITTSADNTEEAELNLRKSSRLGGGLNLVHTVTSSPLAEQSRSTGEINTVDAEEEKLNLRRSPRLRSGLAKFSCPPQSPGLTMASLHIDSPKEKSKGVSNLGDEKLAEKEQSTTCVTARTETFSPRRSPRVHQPIKL